MTTKMLMHSILVWIVLLATLSRRVKAECDWGNYVSVIQGQEEFHSVDYLRFAINEKTMDLAVGGLEV